MRNADSEHYDSPLLERITHFQRVFKKGPFTGVGFTSRRYSPRSPARLTPELVESARVLLGKTPAPQRVRIVGQLDGLVASTQRFSLLLDNGEKVVGVFAEDQADAMQPLWRKRVLVLGTAIYRASGRLLRVDAEKVGPGGNEASIFSRLPMPPHARLDVSRLRKPQGPRSGMAAIMGQWPGDESGRLRPSSIIIMGAQMGDVTVRPAMYAPNMMKPLFASSNSGSESVRPMESERLGLSRGGEGGEAGEVSIGAPALRPAACQGLPQKPERPCA
jgi:hypothetical protein